MHTMHEYVVDIVVIADRLQLNVESEKKCDRPAKLGTSRAEGYQEKEIAVRLARRAVLVEWSA